MVTPNSLACQTCAISLPSIFIFGIVLLKLPSCAKLMIISFDFSELIFMSFCSVHLAAISTGSCITDTSFLSHISNNVLSSTYLYNGTVVLKSFYVNKETFRSRQCPLRYYPIGMTRMGIFISYFYSLSSV